MEMEYQGMKYSNHLCHTWLVLFEPVSRSIRGDSGPLASTSETMVTSPFTTLELYKSLNWGGGGITMTIMTSYNDLFMSV